MSMKITGTTLDVMAAMETVAAGLTIIKDVEEDLADRTVADRCAIRMTLAMILLVELSGRTGKEVDKHPRLVAQQIIEQALAQMPEMPPADLPERQSKTKGPSPWGL